MKRAAFLTLWPSLLHLSDGIAAQLLDILEQLHGGTQHHCGPRLSAGWIARAAVCQPPPDGEPF